MKITIVSDTHCQHERLGRLSGDVLIHCGDMFRLPRSGPKELESIDRWFGEQAFGLILCTSGNHDRALQERLKVSDQPFRNAIFLQDRGYLYRGVTFYGAPWTPMLRSHAFFMDDPGLIEKWAKIPTGTDVLITHTPPAHVLDVSSRGISLGCEHLAAVVQTVAPSLHCFGHVHASRGVHEANGTRFVNASSVNSQFEMVHEPYEIELSSSNGRGVAKVLQRATGE